MHVPNPLKPIARSVYFTLLGFKDSIDALFFRVPHVPGDFSIRRCPDLLSPKPQSAKVKEYVKKVMAHKFDLLGSGDISLGKDIEWNKDFKSGYVWRNGYHKSLKITDEKNNADVKVAWELSRFQHLPLLCAAYLETKDSVYLDEFKSELASWSEQNPYGFSVNWACTMDVAIRSVNLLFSYQLIVDHLDQETRIWLDRSLYQHAKFIRSNLEWSLRRTNHYISDICGLYILSLFLECPESDEWKSFARKELESEIQTQVFSDGADWECSSSYHGLVLELFLLPYILGEKMGQGFSAEYRDILKKMLDFQAWCTKPDGMTPQIGDNDNGHLFRFDPTLSANDHRSILALGAVLFKDPVYAGLASGFTDDAYWLLGQEGKSIFGRIEGKPLNGCRYFDQVGVFVYRKGGVFLLFNIGTEKGVPGHKHNDLLSIELQVGGSDIFVDPGTGAYSSDYALRNRLRSVESHNTYTVGNAQPRRFSEKLLFSMDETTKSKLVSFNHGAIDGNAADTDEEADEEKLVEIKGCYEAFGFPCYRTISIGDGLIRVSDDCESTDCVGYLQIPFFDARIGRDGKSADIDGIHLESTSKLDLDQALYSPSYGLTKDSTRLTYKFSKRNLLKIRF